MLSPGDTVDGKYKVVRLIGEGGMGAVFEGENTAISRRVAIKVLHPHAALSEDAVMRFKREARAAGKIGNDHILEILDLGALADGAHYMVMEFLDGEPLAARIERGPLPPAEVVSIALQLLAGLGAAHSAGIIHRDLKPDNIFLVREKAGRRDFVKLIDFGISKFQRLGEEGGEMHMTQTGTLMGTPYYMSPEQAKGTPPPDLRSDIYSIGVILYEALSGRVPFDAKNFNELMFKIALEEAPALASVAPSIDPRLADIVQRAMAKNPDHRPPTCEALSQELSAWLATAGDALHAPAPAMRLSSHELPQGSATASNWSQSGAHVAPPAPSKSPVLLLAGLGAFGLLLVLGGSVLAYTWASSSKAAGPPPVASEAVETTTEGEPTPSSSLTAPPPDPVETDADAAASTPDAPPPESDKPVAKTTKLPTGAKPPPTGTAPTSKPPPKATGTGLGKAGEWY
ncbi:MAG: protein kinase [Polyangiaceae bacterium]|nr:protein kinase [Polyangiaceae bacterium]